VKIAMTLDWKSCCDTLYAKSVKPDKGLIDSLLKTSENKMASQKRLQLDDVTASSKISLAYDCLRELLEALALRSGYKIYNHECFVSFLKEIIKEDQKGDDFDRIRKVRNAINYYGKDITSSEAIELIRDIENLAQWARKRVK
jgi:hypothetical protein